MQPEEMLDYITFFPSGRIANILDCSNLHIALCVIALCSAFLWYRWKKRSFLDLPLVNMEFKALFELTVGRYLTDATVTNIAFQVLLKGVKSFRDKGICVVWFFTPYVFVYREKYMKYLVNEPDLANKATAYDINKLVFGDGLLGSKHEVWKVHRKLMNPMFSLGVLKTQILSMNKHALLLTKKLEMAAGKPIDNAMEILKYYAFLTMTDFVFGMKFNDERKELIEKYIKSSNMILELFISRILRPWLYWDSLLPLFQEGRKYLKHLYDINRLMRDIIKELIAERQKVNTPVINSCGSMLIDLRHRDNSSFTEQEMIDHMLTLTTSGFDTIATTMFYCFYTLGHHPEVQERVYSEIQSVVPEGDLTYEDLTKLKYLRCVIQETQRLYTVIPIIGRKASKDIQCDQYNFPKGTDIYFFIYELHRDPNVFPNPEKFDPERFLDNSSLRPWMYIPFAEGYRNCIGKKYAFMEMGVQLVHVLRRFRITSLNKIEEEDLDWGITLQPPEYARFSFEKRHPKN